jgi:hypothetical protein
MSDAKLDVPPNGNTYLWRELLPKQSSQSTFTNKVFNANEKFFDIFLADQYQYSYSADSHRRKHLLSLDAVNPVV